VNTLAVKASSLWLPGARSGQSLDFAAVLYRVMRDGDLVEFRPG
jgi:hypothetical protein